MTREEALNEIRSWAIPSKKGREVLQTLIPELAESEDERIRKWLLDYAIEMIAGLESDISLSNYDGIKGHDPEAEAELAQWQKARAWLEKQKENIEKEYVFRPLAGTDINSAALQAIRKADEGDRLVLAFNGAYIPVRKGCNANKIVDIYDAFIEKQKEPHYTKRNALFDKCVENCDPEVMKKVSDEVDEMLEKEQKPAEWSEEDDMLMDELESYILYDKEFNGEQKSWRIKRLKSLRPQPKQKVNNVITPNKEFFQWIYNRLVDVHKENPNVDYMISFKKRIEELSFDRPSWKPSEDEERLINTSISFLKDFADKGYENAVECIDWLKSKLNGNTCK